MKNHFLKDSDEIFAVDNCLSSDIFGRLPYIKIGNDTYLEKNFYIIYGEHSKVLTKFKMVLLYRKGKLFKIYNDEKFSLSFKNLNIFPEIKEFFKEKPELVDCPSCIFL